MWRAHDGMGWWMVFGSLLWIAFWGAVVYLVVHVLARAWGEQRPSRSRTDAPVDIARRRYAAGEIDREEFLRLRDDLR